MMLKNPNHIYGPTNVWVPVKLNFGDYMIRKLLEYNKTAIINAATDEHMTYHELAQRALNVAVSLTRIGVKRGDTVALCSENRQEFVPVVIGVACTGATLTTINTGYSKGELKHVLNISKPKHIFISQAAYKTHENQWKTCSFIKNVFLFGNEKRQGTFLYNDLAIAEPNNVNGLTKNIDIEEFEAVDVQGQTDTLFILYSSGTTGMPKGVMLTHLNVLTLCCATWPLNGSFPLMIAPWFHVMGLLGILKNLSLGWTSVYIPKFEINLYLDTIEKYKTDQIIVVPSLLVALCKTQTQHDLSSVKLVYCGAAPLRKDTVQEACNRFPNVEAVLQGYGMTETTYTITRDSEVDLAKPGGVGAVYSSIVLKVADIETRKTLGPNEQGEICAKGAMIMKGYVGKDSKEDMDSEGFYKTGDIGYYDQDGYFFIVDRLKEVIKYKGYQVPPAEIEAVLLQHEAVRDAGVVGIEKKEVGEVPLAFVVTQPGKSVTEKELQEFVAEKLSNPKHLRGGVRFISEIPRNPSGKVLRRELKKLTKLRQGKSKL